MAAVGVAGDLLAQAVRGGGGAGAAPEVDGRDHRVARAQLPGLAAPGVGAEVEAGGDLVVRRAGPALVHLGLGDPVEAVVLDRGVTRGAGGEIPVLVEVEEPERLHLARAVGAAPHRAVAEGDPLPGPERAVEQHHQLGGGAGAGRDQAGVGLVPPGGVHRQVARQLPHRRLGVLREERVAELAHPRRGGGHGGELVGLEGEGRERLVAVAVDLARPRGAARCGG